MRRRAAELLEEHPIAPERVRKAGPGGKPAAVAGGKPSGKPAASTSAKDASGKAAAARPCDGVPLMVLYDADGNMVYAIDPASPNLIEVGSASDLTGGR